MASLIDGRTTPLTFTFVPAVGTLPSQVLVGKDSVYLPKILIGHKEEMAQKNTEESERILDKNTDENSRSFSVTRHKWNSERDFAKEEPASHSVKEIKHNDLFIAEFVAVMDSDDGEDELSKKQNQSIKPFEEKGCDFRGIQQSTRAKPNADIARANENKMHFSKADDFSYDVSDQELPPLCALPKIGMDSYGPQFSILLHPSKGNLEYEGHSTCTHVVDNIDEKQPEASHKISKPLLSQTSHPFKIVHSESTDTQLPSSSSFLTHSNLQSHYTPLNKRITSNSLSPLPIQIIKYPLCQSPSPLNSVYGSSSTICSMNESPSPIPRPEVSSSAPSRLSFLTSLLKSRTSTCDRPLSPDSTYSGTKTFSQHLPSSKAARTSSPPRKSQSCFSLNYSKDSKCSNVQRKNEVIPSASDSDILHSTSPVHSYALRSLSSQSVGLKSSSNSLLSRTRAVSQLQQLPHQLSPTSHSNGDNITPLNEKPPLNRQCYTSLKKYPVFGKSKRITLSPSPLPFQRSSSIAASQKQNVMPYVKRCVPVKDTLRSSYNANENLEQRRAGSSSPMDITKSHRFPPFYQKTQLFHENIDPNLEMFPLVSPNHTPPFQSYEELSRISALPKNVLAFPRSHLTKSCELLSANSDQENKQSYKIKSNYKAFAAIPTNTLLRDQKAIDEAAITRDNTTCEEDMDTHSEMCSPALLRQQTEEICAAIDEVLHDDPLPMNYKPASKPTTKKDLKTGNVTKTPPKTAGRETKYASIRHFTGARASNLQTKPGVIRPMSLKISTEEITDGHYSPFNFQKYSMPQYRRDTDYAERTQRREMSSDR
ncbi:muscular LMNA-interacting protein isoform X1 [Hyperolius riggenbachi]|uniref:muscular LMNA-interacting protein isoform X1 n=1 Tax=Hyperolius riggenbachi TaxID=752182 RepID=UPI0035A28E29